MAEASSVPTMQRIAMQRTAETKQAIDKLNTLSMRYLFEGNEQDYRDLQQLLVGLKDGYNNVTSLSAQWGNRFTFSHFKSQFTFLNRKSQRNESRPHSVGNQGCS